MDALSLWELGILNGIARFCQAAWLDVVMPAVSWLGNAGILWILLGLGILALDKKHRTVGVQVLIALLLSLLLCNLLLKNAVDRIRPFVLNPIVELLIAPPGDPSFPSGHTSAAFAAAMVLILTRWRGRWAILCLAVLMAFSRLYLYVHFPTDVLGGAIIGCLCGWLSVTLWKKCLSKHIPSRWKTT